MKYVVARFISGDLKIEMPFMFPNIVVHSEFAEMMHEVGFRHSWEFDKVVAAGFIEDGICHGDSESLGISSRKEVDTRLFKTTDYGGGIS